MRIFLIIMAVVAVIALILLYYMFYGMGTIKKMVIKEINLSKYPDGTYKGSYHKNRWTYDVEIIIRNHMVISVKNTNKRMNMFKVLNNKLGYTLIQKQKIPFDTVSGATVNTKAFLKAVENSLSSIK